MYEIITTGQKERFDKLGLQRSNLQKALILALQDWAQADNRAYVDGPNDSLNTVAQKRWSLAVSTLVECSAVDIFSLREEISNPKKSEELKFGKYDVDACLMDALNRAKLNGEEQ